MAGTQSRRKRARADVVCTIIAFVVLQLAFVAAVDFKRPGWWDPESQVRLRLLRERMEEQPDRQLLVVAGSSRIGAGFLPSEVPPIQTPDGKPVLLFNYSHLAAGPRMNLMQFRRIFNEGITPRWLVLEIVPGSLVHERPPAEMATARDVAALCRHAAWYDVVPLYVRTRLNPFFNHRQAVLGSVAPPFVTRADRRDEVKLLPLGDDDHWQHGDPIDPAMRAYRAAEVKRIYFERFQNFNMDPLLVSATREILKVCRERNISVVLLLSPENSAFRSWHSAETLRRIDGLMRELQQDFQVPLVDARTWVDDDGFNDPHHMHIGGARVFTQRLERELLRPLAAGTLK